jgi:iron complex transport system substrate-binding protein
MKKTIFGITLLLSMLVILSACSPAAAPQAPSAAITIKDGLGRSISLANPPKKIVSLAPSNTEILFAIGAGPQMAARDDFSDTPNEAKQLPSVGSWMGKYNMETLASLQPDLVLASSLNTEQQVKAIEDLKITVFYLENPKDIEGVYTNIKTVGTLTGHDKEAAQVVANLQARVKKVLDVLAKDNTQPKVYYELDGTDPSKPWTAGPGSFMDQIIKTAGALNAGANLPSQWAQISLEELLVQNPDIIILGDANFGTTIDQVVARPGWDQLKAIKDNKIITFDDNLVSRPGPRIVDGFEQLAKILHPELFK